MTRRVLYLLFVLVSLGSLGGCEAFSFMDDDEPVGPEPVEIDYAKLAERYNRRTGRIGSIHARAVVEIDFTNANGKQQFEQGDGKFMYRRPLDLAMTIGKLGEIILWIGGDRERYWWLELKPSGDAPTTAYVGRHDERVSLDDGTGPLPVGPGELLALMGLAPIAGPEESHPMPEPVDDGKRVWVTAYLGAAKGAPPARHTLIDVATGRPLESKIVDKDGKVIVASKLSNYEPMKVMGKPPGDWPWLPTRIEMTAPSRKARLTLYLSDATDGKEGDKIKDAQFDFQKLVDLLDVQRTRVIRPHSEAAAGARPIAESEQP